LTLILAQDRLVDSKSLDLKRKHQDDKKKAFMRNPRESAIDESVNQRLSCRFFWGEFWMLEHIVQNIGVVRFVLLRCAIGLVLSMVSQVPAGGLAFSDPSHVAPPPAGAIGFSHRQAAFDVAPGFQNPPPGYGIVPFYWWMGDPLTQERLAWQLEQMEGMGVSGYQINYAHSDKGGRSHGLTYPSDPPLFSAAWWELTRWFMTEAKKQGAAVSLSDYTLGIGQGWCVDSILEEHPETAGMLLKMNSQGQVYPETVPLSFNPMHPKSGSLYADEFFGQFERHFPGEGGRGLNFFFSDELGFGVNGLLWSDQFADEFRRRKGYDIMPELAALFKDIGPRTPKIRLDYSDVKVALTEEGFFKPVFDWHQQRGMITGCDHGGRGKRVDEFGDYFRTQRWNQGPGADQPLLRKDLIKAKVAASIAHLYERPRVWLEGFYSSGWGTTSEALVDATLANYAMGFNLLGLHGMYYSTHGGWWEWAPPDNTFRMPYWKHLRTFMDCQQRLAYLLSQGHHCCDVAILYPVAPSQAGLGGKEAVNAAFETAEQIYAQGIDFDFMDFQSLARAKVVGSELHVSGERYRVLILPGMRAVRHSTLLKAVEFHRAGGIVLAVGALPEVSDRVGRDDPQVASMVNELFPTGSTTDIVSAIPFRDYKGPGYILHRRIGPRDVYTVYNAPKGQEVFFRAVGKVELWDPWTGLMHPLPVLSQDETQTRLKLPLGEKEIQLIVFSPGKAVMAKDITPAASQVVKLDGPWEFELEPTLDNRFGDYHWPPTSANIGAEARRLKYAEETTPGCRWQDPALDDSNWRTQTCGFGQQFWKLGPLPDGAEADAVLAKLAAVDPAQPVQIAGQVYHWQPYEFSWRFGIEGDCGRQGYHGLKEQIADEFIGLGDIRHGHPVCRRVPEAGGKRYYLWTTVSAEKDGQVPVSATGLLPAAAWLNGEPFETKARLATLKKGPNPLLLRYDDIGRGSIVFGVASEKSDPPAAETTGMPWNTDLAMRWYHESARLPFDTRPQAERPTGWYRFTSPPGLETLTIPTRGQVQVWADGKQLPVHVEGELVTVRVPQPVRKPVVVALRIQQQRGQYGGAALNDYIRLDCGKGDIPLGDWSQMGVLETYSGSAWYRRTVQLTAAQARGKVTLDLGRVAASAEVIINGKSAGIKVAPPWRVDLTTLVKEGQNRIEILVCNTLANHYVTIPTHYRGSTVSGLIGPVHIELQEEPVEYNKFL
jgi:hypothetical protein